MRLDWNPHIYKRYVPLVGSATAQQIVRKNNEAWRSFLTLKRMERNGELPSTIKRVKPPGYWKHDGRYLLRILFRCDSYHIRESRLQLPRGLLIPFKGELKWTGKQGRLQVARLQWKRCVFWGSSVCLQNSTCCMFVESLPVNLF